MLLCLYVVGVSSGCVTPNNLRDCAGLQALRDATDIGGTGKRLNWDNKTDICKFDGEHSALFARRGHWLRGRCRTAVVVQPRKPSLCSFRILPPPTHGFSFFFFSIPSGIKCGVNGRVVEVDLHNTELLGFLPDDISMLDELQRLYLWSNQLYGKLPVSLGNLKYLTDLVLEENSFDGTIPPELGRLSQLTYLGLSYNKLVGAIPSSIGNLTKLSLLKLDYNQIQGDIPEALCNLRELTYLILGYNQVSVSNWFL